MQNITIENLAFKCIVKTHVRLKIIEEEIGDEQSKKLLHPGVYDSILHKLETIITVFICSWNV